MTIEQFANNAATNVGVGGIDNSSTSLLVTSSAAPFPQTGNFRILVNNEIMLVTAVPDGTHFTVTRAQEGTTAASHSAGSAVTHIVTSGSLAQFRTDTLSMAPPAVIYGNTLWGTPHLASGEYVTVAASGTQTLLDTSVSFANKPGYIDRIWIGTLTANSHTALESATISVYYDGEGSPSLSFPAGLLWSTPWNSAVKYDSGNFGFQWVGNDGAGWWTVNIPFTTSVKVTITNGDSGHTVQFFWDISYKICAQALSWGNCKKLLCNVCNGTSVVHYATQTLLSYSGGPGLFYGLTMVMKGGDSNVNYLEGNFVVTIDGTTTLNWSGTEDFFIDSSYFAGGIRATHDHGCIGINSSASYAAAYRWFLNDPIPFTSSLSVTWANGDSGEATVTANTAIFTSAWYYTP